MSHVKDGLACAWAGDLTQRAGFAFFPHRHDGETAPPFGVVVVKRLRQSMPRENVHLAELRVVVVSDVSDPDAAEGTPRHQQALVKAAWYAIENTPRYGVDAGNGVRLCGFEIEDVEQASGSGDDGRKVYSDVFLISAGVASVGVEDPPLPTMEIPDFSAVFNAALND